MFKKKYLLLTVFLIIIFQILLYINNNQKTSFRYFKWTLQEVSIGKLISISFFSGLFVSTLLNTAITIRTMIVKPTIDGKYDVSVQAGAGIVADSFPENEYQETINKAKGILKAFDCLDK